MTFNQFIWRNTSRNRSLYLAYFMSVLFSVMVFFTFSVFANHPYLLTNIGNSATTGLRGAQFIIYGFAFFFVLYSIGVFLQSRKREFGTLLIQGMSPRQLRQMVFLENFLIGLVATVSGIAVGLVFSGAVLSVSEWLLGFSIPLYLPLAAIATTLLAFVVLFGLISIVIQFRLPKLSVQTLLKSAENGQGELKTSRLKTIAAVLLIGAGYVMASVTKGATVVMVFFPVLILVVVGTYFLFHQFCVRLAKGLTQRKAIFWKRTNMLLFSDLAFRMKENARAFFLVSIISTVAFAAIGTLLGVRTMMRAGVDSQMVDITYTISAGQSVKESVVHDIDATLRAQNGVVFQREKIDFKLVEQSDQSNIQVAKASEVNRLMQIKGQSPIAIGDNEAVRLELGVSIGSVFSDTLVTKTQTYPIRTVAAKQSPFYPGVVIVGDTLYDALTSDYALSEVMWFVQGGQERDLGKALSDTIERLEVDPGQINAKAMNGMMIMSVINPTLFVGLFIGIVFFISAGSFLYFRLYSDFDMDVQKFSMIRKIGLTNRELKHMLSKQIGILFFVPIIVSLVHGFVALSAMFRIFEQSISMESIVLLAVFALIQLVFYLVARQIYIKKIQSAILG